MPYGAEPQDIDEYMLGTVYVTVVLLESDGSIDPDLENWTPSQIAGVKTKVAQGLRWWEETLSLQGSVHTLEYILDYTYADSPVNTPYEPLSRPSTDQGLWVDSFLDAVGANTTADHRSDMRAFNHQQRIAADTNWAFTIFFTNSAHDPDGCYADGANAWAYAGGPYTVLQGRQSNSTIAHEVGHIFYALDEYEGGRSYFDRRGYYNTQNLNAFEDHPDPESRVLSIMDGVSRSTCFANHLISPSGAAMLGWQDSDGDGVFDVLDVPLAFQGAGQYNPATRNYEFKGIASVQTVPNLNPSGLGHDITINRVDRVQYRLNGGAWTDAMTCDAYQATFDLEVGPLSGGLHQIEIRVGGTVSGTTPPPFHGDTDRASMVPCEGINGFVWWDANGNSVWGAGERTLDGWRVNLLDENQNPVKSVDGVEPDDYAHGTILNAIRSTVTLTSIGSEVSGNEVYSRTREPASTGIRVFCHRLTDGSWNSVWKANSRQLRIDFHSPVNTVSIDAIGSYSSNRGRLRVFDVQGRMIGTYETTILPDGGIETMTLSRPEADIAYAIADSAPGYVVRLDHLQFGRDTSAITGPFGEYRFAGVSPGQYFVQVITRAGWDPTSPATGMRPVLVSGSGIIEDVNLGMHVTTPGDANGDGSVNDLDASILAANWQRTGGATWVTADFNGDGDVNDLDASILAANWQAQSTPPGAASGRASSARGNAAAGAGRGTGDNGRGPGGEGEPRFIGPRPMPDTAVAPRQLLPLYLLPTDEAGRPASWAPRRAVSASQAAQPLLSEMRSPRRCPAAHDGALTETSRLPEALCGPIAWTYGLLPAWQPRRSVRVLRVRERAVDLVLAADRPS